MEGLAFPSELDFSLSCLLERQTLTKKNDIVDVFEYIWHGGVPDALFADAEQRQEYFNSYIETYLMRGVSEEGGIVCMCEEVIPINFLIAFPWGNESARNIDNRTYIC